MSLSAKGMKCCSSCPVERYTVGGGGTKTWQSLKFVGLQVFEHGEAFELRNCACGSTLAWPIDCAEANAGRVAYLQVDFQLAEAA